MPIQTDILQTLFVVKGLSTLMSAFEADGNAQKKLDAIQAKINANNYRGIVLKNMNKKLLAAQTEATEAAAKAELAFAGVIAGASVKALQSLVGGISDAVQAYTEFGTQVANIRDLTGASAKESAEAAELFRVAGVKDTQAIRDYLRLAKDLQSSQGQQGLGMLGISSTQGENSVHLLGRIIDKLQQMPAGIQKARVEEELFGTRGAVALQGLLRLTHEQREQALALGDAFGSEGLAAIQSFQFGIAMLGETVMVKLVYPFAQRLLPVLGFIVDKTIVFTAWVGHLNSMTGGVLVFAGAFAAIGTAIAGVMMVIPPLLTALKSVALVEAVIDALAGQWQNLAAGLAVGAVAGIGLYGIGQFGGSGQSDNTNALNSNTEATQNAANAMNKFTDAWMQANRGGIPRGLQRGDIAELSRQHALGIIG
jgi:hypothetical protein